MNELFLVRHGQASFGSEDYDRLSPLGLQQSAWLGQYFADRGVHFDRVLSGTLNRQQQTASTLLEAAGQQIPVISEPALNEFDFHAIGSLYCRQTGTPLPSAAAGPRPFFQLLRLAIRAWSEGKLHTPDSVELETWEAFSERARTAVRTLALSGKGNGKGERERLLAISSGGLMAMILMQTLECSVESMINLNLQIRNTGICQLYLSGDRVLLGSFNAVPHLDHPERLHALSHA